MRIDYRDHPEITGPLRELTAASSAGTLEPLLLELVKVRASQLNGCAHCLEMHTKDARALGESDDRLHLVATWREAPCFSARERAALAWCEELTLIAEREVPDELYEQVRAQLSEDELTRLTLAVIVINSWNRLAIAFRAPVGGYVSRHGAPRSAAS
ncbi:MAG TPA: carboxymuconolactone decarboxylase family protein [Acidimicrobiales bacterium]|nr:carboxymuconolactone decarboxylase family protein [Acidimicrobiales bacterium]